MQNRKRESLGHDTHDRVWRVTKTYRSAEDTGVGIELTLPLLVADDEDGR